MISSFLPEQKLKLEIHLLSQEPEKICDFHRVSCGWPKATSQILMGIRWLQMKSMVTSFSRIQHQLKIHQRQNQPKLTNSNKKVKSPIWRLISMNWINWEAGIVEEIWKDREKPSDKLWTSFYIEELVLFVFRFIPSFQ